MARRKTLPDRATRGIRFSDSEWTTVKGLADKAGLGIGEYIRARSLPPVPLAAPRSDCEHETVLVVPGRLVGGLELCQCAQCGLLGSAHPDSKVRWAS